jgi:DNA polymerase I
MSKVILIDGHSILNRAYYGIPLLSNAEGLHTNAVYGFLNIMFKILDEEKADYLAVAFDVHAPTFRHEMFEAYKGTRKPMPEELREQVPVIKEVLHAMQIPTLEHAGYEADDILGTLGKAYEAAGYDVSIISGDRDLLQLATDKIKIRIPNTQDNVQNSLFLSPMLLSTSSSSSNPLLKALSCQGNPVQYRHRYSCPLTD